MDLNPCAATRGTPPSCAPAVRVYVPPMIRTLTALALCLTFAACDQVIRETVEEVLTEENDTPVLCRPAELAPSILKIADQEIEEPLAAAGVEVNDFGHAVIKLTLTTKQSKWFTEFTKDNIGETAEVAVDGEVLASPKIMEPIYGSDVRISGNFTMTEAESLALKLAPPCR